MDEFFLDDQKDPKRFREWHIYNPIERRNDTPYG